MHLKNVIQCGFLSVATLMMPLQAQTLSESAPQLQEVVRVSDKIEVMQFDGAKIHTYYGVSNSHIVETAHHLYLIDAQMTQSHATEIKDYIETLDKPLQQVVISHYHPDHWFGAPVFKGLAPIVTSQAIQEDFVSGAQRYIDLLKDQLGDEAPDSVITLDGIVTLGKQKWDSLEVEIVEFADHEAPHSIAIKIPELGVFIGQDLLYNKAFLVATERVRNQNWVNILSELSQPEFVNAYPLAFVGHGKNGTPAIYAQQVGYLNTLETLLQQGLSKDEVREAIKAAYTDYASEGMLEISLRNLFSEEH